LKNRRQRLRFQNAIGQTATDELHKASPINPSVKQFISVVGHLKFIVSCSRIQKDGSFIWISLNGRLAEKNHF
jgi:hypothetical protein